MLGYLCPKFILGLKTGQVFAMWSNSPLLASGDYVKGPKECGMKKFCYQSHTPLTSYGLQGLANPWDIDRCDTCVSSAGNVRCNVVPASDKNACHTISTYFCGQVNFLWLMQRFTHLLPHTLPQPYNFATSIKVNYAMSLKAPYF